MHWERALAAMWHNLRVAKSNVVRCEACVASVEKTVARDEQKLAKLLARVR